MNQHNSEKRVFFLDRKERFQKEYQDKKKYSQLIGWLRILSFVVTAVIIYLLFRNREIAWSIYTVILYVPVFGLLVNFHNRKKKDLRTTGALTHINEDEINRLDRNFKGLDGGSEFLKIDHPYAVDLDIFGVHAVFQLLNRSDFAGSKKKLASWLSHSAKSPEVTQRQESIAELRDSLDWCQRNVAFSKNSKRNDKESVDLHALVHRLKIDTESFNQTIWGVLQILLPLISISVLAICYFLKLDFRWILAPVALNLVFLKVAFAPLINLTKNLMGANELLLSYEDFLIAIERKSFDSPLLNKLKSSINKDQQASSTLKSLRISVDLLTNRGNLFYQTLNMLFALDLFILLRIRNWCNLYGKQVKAWLDLADEISVLSDLGTFAFAHEDYVFPNISDEKHLIEARGLFHPMMPYHQAISNNFETHEKGKLALITGSNMSGKSTFLRTLGVNVVLAQMGAPVAASHFSLSQVKVFSSMRTQDNLEESVSSFYAELKRIKQLLDQIDDETPTLYLLDEILKGTNTKDRHAGAIALIQQLTSENCMGLISTHDVELAELQNPQITNYSFNSTLEDDEIVFDYQLTDGPCKSFNASALMKKMGIIKNPKKDH